MSSTSSSTEKQIAVDVKKRSGLVAWTGLFTYVLGYDLWAWLTGSPSLSAHWAAWLRTHAGRSACIAFWALLTAHLFFGWGKVPERKRR